MRIHLTKKSSNAKTGPIPVSTSSSETCPPSCPFKSKGCYAKSGPLAIHWAAVTKGERGMDWSEFCREISGLPERQAWRHNQAGDLPGVGEDIDAAQLAELVKANTGRRGWTYTHKYGTAENLEAIRAANEGGFTVNLSANTLAHADELANKGVGPICVVLPSDAEKNTMTPDGRRVVICPATRWDNIDCASCMLCQRQRSVIVGFPAHGSSKTTVNLIVST
jgi:hypothetical protein